MVFSKKDWEWQSYNKKLEGFMLNNDYFGMGTTYYEMASFVKEEGKDPETYRELGYIMKLKVLKESLRVLSYSGVVNSVQVLTTTGCCKYCKKLHAKMLKINEATTRNPIPVRNCLSKYGCRCSYIAVVEGVEPIL